MLLSTILLTGCSSNLPPVLNPGSATQALDLLPYALDNNIQVFELYPDE
jgi:hypothetical protein